MITREMAAVRGRQWVAGVLAGVATAVVIGVPTGIIETDFFVRMTPVLWWNYPVWVLTAVLEGLIVATFFRPRMAQVAVGGRGAVAGGVGGLLAVGCPICNKLVLLALGTGGALSFFAPIQPYLGVLSLLLLGFALRQRLRPSSTCPVPVRPHDSVPG